MDGLQVCVQVCIQDGVLLQGAPDPGWNLDVGAALFKNLYLATSLIPAPEPYIYQLVKRPRHSIETNQFR